MGRPNILTNQNATVYLQPVKFQDGNYDKGGAYLGGYLSQPLYIAASPNWDFFFSQRADARQEAKPEIQNQFPNLKFKR